MYDHFPVLELVLFESATAEFNTHVITGTQNPQNLQSLVEMLLYPVHYLASESSFLDFLAVDEVFSPTPTNSLPLSLPLSLPPSLPPSLSRIPM